MYELDGRLVTGFCHRAWVDTDYFNPTIVMIISIDYS